MPTVAAPPEWQLDKRVPIALIFAIAVQTSGGIWWAATVTQRVDGIERRTNALEGVQVKMLETDIRVNESLAGIRTGQEDVRRSLTRIEHGIDVRRAP